MGYRRIIVGYSAIVYFALLACTTTSTPPVVSSSQLAKCFCGRPAASQENCAVWSTAPVEKSATPVIRSVVAAQCDLKVCTEQFQADCQSIRLWPFATLQASWPPQEQCFCDATWVELDRKPQIACAAWSPQHPWLIEYYPLAQCPPGRCGRPPFHLASRLCPNGFQAFYHPWGARASRPTQDDRQ